MKVSTSALLALALAACSSVSGEPVGDQAHADLLRDGCLASEMRREPFERLAAERGWGKLIPRVVVAPGQTLAQAIRAMDDGTWDRAYGDRDLRIIMSGLSAAPDPSSATVCEVSGPEPRGDWRSDLEQVAAALQMRPLEPSPAPEGAKERTWSASDGVDPMTLSYKLSRKELVVRLARRSAMNAE